MSDRELFEVSAAAYETCQPRLAALMAENERQQAGWSWRPAGASAKFTATRRLWGPLVKVMCEWHDDQALRHNCRGATTLYLGPNRRLAGEGGEAWWHIGPGAPVGRVQFERCAFARLVAMLGCCD